MGLFDQPVTEVRAFLASVERRGLVRTFPPLPPAALERWVCDEAPVVLSNESGLELGSTSASSLSLLTWEEGPATPDEVLLVGADLPEIAGASMRPFALVVTARVDLERDDHYDCYRRLREATYHGSVQLRGVMTRVLPGRQRIWCRVSCESLSRGLDARVLGSALCASVRSLAFVRSVRVALVTAGADVIAQLGTAADLVQDIGAALVRMHEQGIEMDCGDCEFEAVCDTVDELRALHEQLVDGQQEEGR